MPATVIGNAKPSVFIAPKGNAYGTGMYKGMFAWAGFKEATTLKDADLVCFTGGADVSPEYYGQKAISGVHLNRTRDSIDKQIYENARKMNKRLVGICRGGQFLNIMAGGTMWQDVNNHTGNHQAYIQTGMYKDLMVEVTSTHHQMMRIRNEHEVDSNTEILLVAYEATEYEDAGGKAQHDVKAMKEFKAKHKKGFSPTEQDMEAVFYKDTGALCFQPHPEFPDAPKDCRELFFDFLCMYHDFDVHDRVFLGVDKEGAK